MYTHHNINLRMVNCVTRVMTSFQLIAKLVSKMYYNHKNYAGNEWMNCLYICLIMIYHTCLSLLIRVCSIHKRKCVILFSSRSINLISFDPQLFWIHLPDISMQMAGDFLMVDFTSKSFRLKFDQKDSVYLTLDKDMYLDNTRGLCGLLNNDNAGKYWQLQLYKIDDTQVVGEAGDTWLVYPAYLLIL